MRQFSPNGPVPNRKWISDFIYIWTGDGWIYVAAVIDLFSLRVVGWSMSSTMTAQLVNTLLRWPLDHLFHTKECTLCKLRYLPGAGLQREIRFAAAFFVIEPAYRNFGR